MLNKLTRSERERLLQLAISSKLHRNARSSLALINRTSRSESLPLSFAQQRLWFLAQMDGVSRAYHVPFNLRLKGILDTSALRRALDRIVTRHEVLRTTFHLIEGEPIQRIASAESANFFLLDQDLSQSGNTGAGLDQLIAREAEEDFDLETGPLIRGRLVRLAEEDHALLITMHHIISDGWSMGILTGELSTLYKAFLQGNPDPLSALDIQYADYTVWQRKWIAGEVLEQQTDYWKKTLADVPTLLDLPTDHPRPAQQNYAGGFASLHLDEELTSALKELSRRHGTTLFMTLLAGWATLLTRLSSQQDIVIGTPTANRSRTEIENLIGFFVNMLAVRIDFSTVPTVGELLAQVKKQAIAAQQHQDIPFEYVVELMHPVRSLAHSPLFQVAFVWGNTPAGRLDFPGLELSSVSSSSSLLSKFDLTLSLQEINGSLYGGLEYATSLFEPSTIERYLGYLRNQLVGMVADEAQQVHRLPLLHASERHHVLYEWNDTATSYPSEKCIHALFEEQVDRSPEAIAVVFEEQELSYRELNRRANQLAHYLRELGVGPDTRVALCVERSLEMIIALLAVLKAGGAYVPLDPAYPVERLHFMLADAAPVVLLTQSRLQNLFSEYVHGLPVLTLEDPVFWSERPDWNPAPGAIGLTSSHLAYIIYTSGSTGSPKGVAVEHRSVVNRIVWMQHVYGFDTDNAVLQKTSFNFDVSVWEFFLPLFAGSRLVMAQPEKHKDPAYLIETMRRYAITTIHFVPSMLQVFLEHSKAEQFPALSKIICSGEALSSTLTQRVRKLLPHAVLHNLYGPTETTVDVTAWSCSEEVVPGPIPIGRPIANTQVYILDGYGEPVPVGVSGELYIGGAGVARGYLNRPELTAEKFLKDPFRDEPNARMYRTGDLGRWLADGNIEFLGRNDFQVKIRGFRIELGEIEARLADHAAVREAIVVAREDILGDKRLVAYYTVADIASERVDAEELRSYLTATLPEYMVPAAYVRLTAMPLTPNGKLDRGALPAPDEDAYATVGYEAPQGETEKSLAQIWADLLRLDRVGRHDNFFNLGGHSLLAVTLMARMRQAGLQGDIQAVFASPTLAALAAAIRGSDAIEVEVPPNRIPEGCERIVPEMLPLVQLSEEEIAQAVRSVPGGQANVQDIYPLAPLQEGILFHYLMNQRGDPYLLVGLMSFDSRDRLDAYVRAMQAVIDRHDILRTAVRWEGLPEPVQVVWRKASLHIEEVNLSPADGDASDQLYARFDPRHYRIDVGQAPLLRVHIARDEEHDRWLMLQHLHHLIGDHSTLEVMQQEIELYLLGEQDQLVTPLPFRNLVAQARLGISPQAHEEFFHRMLGDVDEPTAPFGLLDVQRDGTGIEQAHLRLDGDLARRLRVSARRLGVSVASLCHLAWALVLAKTTGRKEVVFGTVLFGRMQGGSGSDQAMGLFINTLPVRIAIGQEGVETSVRQVHALLAELLLHEHASLALAQRCSAVAAPAPLFSSLLNYRHSPGAALAPSEATVQAYQGMRWLRGEERTNYPVTLSVEDFGQDLGLTAQTPPSIGPLRICQFMQTTLASLAQALETAPATSVHSLDMLPRSERHRVLYEWNDTATSYPSEKCIHALFEEQVDRSPEAIAVVFEEQELSYRELNRRANQLAHYLRELGVGPDTRVALCVERSLEMIIALLAVLKAGGAYVPLDPAYPVERIQRMLADATPIVVLTQRSLIYLFDDVYCPLLCLNLAEVTAPWWNLSESNPDPISVGLTSSHLAYIIYTSGSTGLPKGVMVQHANVVRLFAATDSWFGFGSTDVAILFHSYAFDFSVWEMWSALFHGARLIIVSKDITRSPEDLYSLICQESVTILNLTPGAFRQLADAQIRSIQKHSLRHIVFGGEALDTVTLRPWYKQERNQRTQLINMYGITETTVHVTYMPLSQIDTEKHNGSPIGSLIPDMRAYILDGYGEPVPVGVSGELYIGGAGVARGYLNRPELTAEKFLKDPFRDEPNARMYRTGDLGRWLADGNIEFLGRNDFQVKIRGFRIELGEIEARLADHAAVREAIVVAREDILGDKRLVAYYTVADTASERVDAEELRSYLTATLPEYMVPAAYVRLTAMPLTPNGKLDRGALPAPDEDAYATVGYEAPQGETEKSLAQIWADLLRLDRVGRHDNFFNLGGHSLLAVTLMARMRQAGLQGDIQAVFASPTLAALAAAIRGSDAIEVEVPPNRIPEGCERIVPEMLPLVQLSEEEIAQAVRSVPGGQANVQDIYPLAPLQEGILFHYLMNQRGDPYLLVGLMSFDSRDRLDAYVRAMQAVIDRHDILRTAVRWEGLPEPVQVVLRKASLHIEEVNLSPADGDASDQLYARFDPRHYRIDVGQAPLLRVHIARDEEHDRWLLLQHLHHLIGDHSTLEVMQQEIELYLLGEQDQLVTPLPFRNLVAQARLGISPQAHEEFFHRMLGDVDEPTAPFGLLDVQRDGTGIEQAHLRLDGDLARRLRVSARRLGVSVASLCHLAWALVLAKTTGRKEVVFGTVLFGRMQGGSGSDQAMGLFINTLPVRIAIGQEGVETSVRQVHALLAELLLHEHASLALAQRCSAVAAPAPLFSSLLNYRHSPGAALAPSEATVQAYQGMRWLRGEERTNYPVTLSVEDFGQDLGLTAQTPPSIGPLRICQFMQTTLASLAQALETAPATSVHSLDMLPRSERHRVLYEWNDTATSYPSEKCIHALFEEQVDRSPEAIAVVFEEQELSYRELNRRANQLAHYLRELGVGPDTRVALCVERSLEMIIALLAVLKAGGAYVPFDPAYPVERLHFMLADAAPVVLLTQSRLQNLFSEYVHGLPVLTLEDPVFWSEQPDWNPAPDAIGLTSSHLAYIIYTSGSTGSPKGVAVEHRSVVNYLRWALSIYIPNEGSVVSSPLAFDATVTSLYCPIIRGGVVELLREGEEINGLSLRLRSSAKPSLIKLTPSHFESLRESNFSDEDFGPGNIFILGGEALSPATTRKWRKNKPTLRLINEYGPTEAVVGCIAYEISGLTPSSGPIPIGRPIANTQVYILDGYGEPVPVGVSGELYIGGGGVARGYLNRPELTAEKFLKDPFRDEPNARMYRTGDLGRWLADGNIEFLGRNDFQVKIRGFRIELGEIEARLADHAAVREAIVVAREDILGDKRLVAYYTVADIASERVDAEELRSYLTATLPEYMVPAAYVRLTAMPLTPNGKLDRGALPAPDEDAYATVGYEAPQGETEKSLAQIWADLLRLDRVGRHDNFFNLGGHSLLAVRLTSRIRQMLGIEVALNDLFTYPTLVDFAHSIDNANRTDLPLINRTSRSESLPLSFAQQRLWFLAQMDGVSRAYHVPFNLRLKGILDTSALRRALDRIVTRHEVLRTTFHLIEGEPIQRIASAESANFFLLDQDLSQSGNTGAGLDQLIAREAEEDFDLETGPLIRGRLVRLAEEDHALLITMHHIISDGWSMGILTGELSTLYKAFLQGNPDPLPALDIQYADYTVWQRKWIAGEVLEQQTDYWKKTLADVPTLLDLPTDHPRPAQQNYAGGFASLHLDEELTSALKELSRRHGTTLFMTLLAGWATLLTRLSSQQDIVIGTPTANRSRTEIENLIGFFVNMLAVRIDFSTVPTVGELLAQVKKQAIAAQQHQDIPFEYVVELMHPVRSLAHSPLFQVAFAWGNTPAGRLDFPGLELSSVSSSSSLLSKFDLTLSLQEINGSLYGGLEYATSLFEPSTIERYLGYLRNQLVGMVADEAQQVHRLPLLDASERHRVLYEWNDTATSFPSEKCIHALFEEQVDRSPEAIAVVFEEQELSYRELNQRANQLAHYLRELGVGPDTRVALCVERSLEMIIALLAVLKAGGAYVPLDPAYPVERLHFMLADAAPVVLLTQSRLQNLFSEYVHGLPVLTLEDPVFWSEQPDWNPAPDAIGLTSSHLAYIIYTSGSTGSPKGVAVEHRNALNLLWWHTTTFALSPGQSSSALSGVGFDASVWEIWPSLCAGVTVIIPTSVETSNLENLLLWWTRQELNISFLPTPAAELFFSRGMANNKLETLLVGGDKLRHLPNEATSFLLVNNYGPTETTVVATSGQVETGAPLPGPIPIGRPIANTQVYILDGYGEPVPVGVSGELYIGGAGIARGYLNRPELTAEKFLKDPFRDEPNARMYRTGDLGRWLADGNIEFLGRNDFQVKIRGFRIELGEIEARLADHAAVREAIVVAREDILGDKRLVAYYTVADIASERVDAEELRSYLTATLPEYMVPAAYVRLTAMPLTPNGKLDRGALPAPDEDAYATVGYEAPQGETEKSLAQIWADLLRLDRVGRHDNFFNLGGHSLLAVTLMARMRQAGLQGDIQAVFASPTLAALAAAIRGSDAIEVEVPPNRIPEGCERIVPEMLPLVQLSEEEIAQAVRSVPGGQANVQDIYPLAPLQEGILFHYLMNQRGDPYLLVGLMSFDSRDRLDAYVRAMQAVIDRHDILRTAVRWEGLPEPVQVVLRKASLHIEEVNLSPADGDASDQLYARFDPRHYRIDVGQAPLLRVHIARDEEHNRWLMLQHLHHLIGDHSTLEVMQQEIELYLLGEQDQLVTPLPFRNLVAQARLGISPQAHEEFFHRMLGDVDEPTAPFGLLDVQRDGTGIEQAHLRLDGDLARRLRVSARRLGVSVASLCHLAWALVLAKTTGRKEVVFGTVLFGRMQGGSGSDQAMGLFINTLPVRIAIGQEGVETSVRQVHALLAELLLHEHASLALAQRCSAVAAPAPLFSSLLNYRHSPGAALAPSEATVQAYQGMRWLRGEERNNYPVTLSVEDFGQDLGLTAQSPPSIGPLRICQFMQTTLASLAQALETAPATSVHSLDMLPRSERHRVLYEWNDTATSYPSEKCIHALFEEQVDRSPEAIAVVFEEQELSYRELNRRANQLAHYLRELGVGPDTRVALCVERSLEMIIALLAVLKAGGAYVPLDPTYPVERLHFMLADAAPVVLLTQSRLQNLFSEYVHGLPVLTLEDPVFWSERPDWNPAPGAIGLTSSHLAYIIYTSGSTGSPKGVAVEHRSVVNRIVWMQHVYGFDTDNAVLQKTSFNFDVSVWEFFLPLFAGSRLVMAQPEKHKDPAYLIETMRRYAITTIHFVPSMLQVFLEHSKAEQFPALSKIICSGEALSFTLTQRVRKLLPHAVLHNLYGPTETTVDVTAWSCSEEVVPGPIPIGRPIANTQVYILDGYGEPVPVGVSGELYIGGAGVARGYLNRPELTAEKFLKDPFRDEPNARMYRTGDLGRWLADGNIEFLGRNDFQVKIRGFRIELGEIEARLADHAAVREAIVVAREDILGDKRLVAYYTVADIASERVDAEELRSYLTATLPEYMVPAAYVRLTAMPLTPNGKLDRGALPAPDEDAYATVGYEAPQGETEKSLAQIWADLLRLDRVGRHDNFFNLGGHSLLAVTLMARMRQAGLQGDIQAVFASPTLAALAAAIRGSDAIEVEVPPNRIPEGCERIVPEMLPLVQLSEEEIAQAVRSVPGGQANVQDIYPLAPLQEGILFHYLMNQRGDPYLLVGLMSFDSRDRLDAYVRAMQAVIDRHDILRTAVRWEGLPEPVQVVLRKASLHIEEVNLSPADGDASDQLYARFDPRHYRIDVGQAPLLRVHIARDEEHNRWLMLQHLHHLIGDHSTLEVMQQEIELYLLGEQDQLVTPLPFRNLVAQARLGISPQAHEEFFHRMLGDVDEPTAPFGLLDVQRDGTGIEQAHLRLDGDLARRLRVSARRLGVSVASLCHLAWALVLAKTTGRKEVVFGTVLFGRMQGGSGSDQAMGLFINTLPVRIAIGQEGVETSVRQVHALLAELLLHEHASLALAQRCSAVAAPAPLFSSLLNYRHSPGAALAPSEATVQAYQGMRWLRGEERTNYPVTLSVEDFGQDLGLTAQTPPSIGPLRICQFMQTTLASLAQALETAPATSVHSLDMLPRSERHRVLYEWNDTATSYPSEKCIHALFEEQVDRSPEAIAVVFEEQELSYRELNRRANQLAHYLRELGVGPDTRVALCVERSLEMIIALLAVLKAGGAYVPLDPAYPVERLHFMLADAAPVVLLTQSRLQNLFSEYVHGLPVLTLEDPVFWSEQPDWNPAPDAIGLTSSHLAYIIYTSGSTGSPKGVAVEHRSVVNLALAQTQAFNIQPESRVLQFASFSFDAFVSEATTSLCHGASLRLVSQEKAWSAQKLTDAVTKHAITHVTLPPTLLAALPHYVDLSPVTTLIVAGDSIKSSLVKQWKEGRKLTNAYGPTETTVCATLCDCAVVDAGPIPIGRPIANTQVYILDGYGEPVPVGVSGELYIGGAGVARGYLNRPELTAEKFLKDPFRDEPNARMYRTGDLGRWLADGNIEFLGRNDFQVKIRGFRIELGEIEARLADHAAVREAIVVAREDILGDKRLVAYYTVADTASERVDAEELRSYLTATLPEYMVPAAYVRLTAVPLTPNGKLDRGALPAPDEDAYATVGYEAPQGETEKSLAQIWADLLRLDRVGRHDNFFNLGGHSLLAVRLIARMQRTLDIKLSINDLLTNQTVVSLASHIDQQQLPTADDKAILIRQGDPSNILFLVHCGSGKLYYAAALALHVHPGISIYGLPPQSSESTPLKTIHGMATRMVKMIHAIQPNGPYNIAGWSFGGLIAFETATQLIGEDQQVKFLGLFDTGYPAGLSNTRTDVSMDYEEDYALSNSLPLDNHLEAAARDEKPAQIRLHESAANDYFAQPLPIITSLFVARRDDFADKSLGWLAILPQRLISSIPLEATHHSMWLHPFVQSTARVLSSAILRDSSSTYSIHERQYSPVETLRRGCRTAPPIFCIPGAGSASTSFIKFVSHLRNDSAIYGMQPRGLETSLIPHSTVESAAKAYLHSIEAICPKGPIHLIGHSFGGWIAFDLAKQWTCLGKAVASLTIFDSNAPNDAADPIPEYNTVDVIMEWLELIQLLLGRSLNIERRDIEPLNESKRLNMLHRKLVEHGLMPRRSHSDLLQGPLRTFASALRTGYNPMDPYIDDVTLVLTDDPRDSTERNLKHREMIVHRWRRRAPNLIYQASSGNHLTLLEEPHVIALATFWDSMHMRA